MRPRETMRWVAVILTVAWLLFRGHAVTIVDTQEVRLQWDGPTTLANGDPFQPGDSISYEVSLDGLLQGTTVEEFFDLSFPAEGSYVLAVRTVRTTAAGLTERSEDAVLETTLVFAPAAPVNLILTRRSQ